MIKGSVLFTGDTLKQGECLSSGNGYYLLMQKDNNLVLYKTMDFRPKNAVWSSQTNRKGFGKMYLIMQKDNNLVLYDQRKKPFWASQTRNYGRGKTFCVIQTDGNFVLYDEYNNGNRKALWATDTHDK